MEWHVPIAILPGIGVLILSTTNQMMALSNELDHLLTHHAIDDYSRRIAALKLDQLKRITRAVTLLYVSAAGFVLAGMLGAVLEHRMVDYIPNFVLIAGVGLVLVALFLLVSYGYRAIRIRQLQVRINYREGEDGANPDRVDRVGS